ncbi:MAG: MFS transporter [Promethearchaeota archaeon]
MPSNQRKINDRTSSAFARIAGPGKFRKIIYGLSRTGSTLLLDIFTVVTLIYYVDVMGLRGILSGLGMAFGKIAIAASGFIMGYVSDRFPRNKLGRRKPFLIIGVPALCISFLFLLLPHLFFAIPVAGVNSPFQGLLFMWATLWSSIFNFSYGFVITPYQSMMPETFPEKERIGASLAENICSFIGTMVGLALTLDLATQMSGWRVVQSVPQWFNEMIITFSIVTIILYLPAILLLPVRDDFISISDTDSSLFQVMKRDTKRVFKNKNYVNFIIFTSITEAGYTISFSALEGYLDNALNVTEDGLLVISAVLLTAALVSTMVWAKVGKKKSLHFAMTIGLYIMVFFVMMTPFIGRSGNPSVTLQSFFLGGLLVGMICEFMYQYVILANIVEEDEIRTGESMSGVYHGVLNLPENIFQGLGTFILGVLLDVKIMGKTDFFGTYDFPIGYFYWGPIAAIFFVIGLFLFKKIKVDLPEIIKLNKEGGAVIGWEKFWDKVKGKFSRKASKVAGKTVEGDLASDNSEIPMRIEPGSTRTGKGSKKISKKKATSAAEEGTKETKEKKGKT